MYDTGTNKNHSVCAFYYYMWHILYESTPSPFYINLCTLGTKCYRKLFGGLFGGCSLLLAQPVNNKTLRYICSLAKIHISCQGYINLCKREVVYFHKVCATCSNKRHIPSGFCWFRCHTY